MKRLLTASGFCVDECIAVTEFVRKRLIDNACVPPQRVHLVRNGISPLLVQGNTDARRLFDIPQERLLLVYAGRLSAYKSVDLMIRMLSLLKSRGFADVHLLLCGDGPQRMELENLTAELELSDQITFAGRRNDLRTFLCSCDVGIQASQGEVGYSLSILEYMSAGLAVVVSDSPAVGAATEHGYTGLKFAAQSVESAADQLQRLYNDPELRSELGRQARASATQDYALEDTHAALVKAIGLLLD